MNIGHCSSSNSLPMEPLLCYGVLIFLSLCLALKLVSSHLISNNNHDMLRSWPILGMVPLLFYDHIQILGSYTKVLNGTSRGTFLLKGPWFTRSEILMTVDPANVQYTSSTKFSNFPRGQKSKNIFDVFGVGYFNTENSVWSSHRKIHRAFFNHKQFTEFSTRICLDKVENGLVRVLDHVAEQGQGRMVVDLQNLFQRYMYDITCRLVVGFDPMSLSPEWPQIPVSHAMNDAMEAAFHRHYLPESLWTVGRWLGIGTEKKLERAKKILHDFALEQVAVRREAWMSKKIDRQAADTNISDILTTYMMEDEQYESTETDEVLAGSVLSLMFAGKDTTSAGLGWFFWLLSKHPDVLAKIREELEGVLPREETFHHLFTSEELSKLVYLHAAISETLRLFPPIPFQSRSPLESDVLPTGHRVDPKKTMIIIPLYMMGRMKAIWGKDGAEFKPERWISEKSGGIKHEPSHKFFSFNAGPRICLGKEVAFLQMKAIAAAMIHNYDVHVLDGQKEAHRQSISLQMKNGLRATVAKRWV